MNKFEMNTRYFCVNSNERSFISKCRHGSVDSTVAGRIDIEPDGCVCLILQLTIRVLALSDNVNSFPDNSPEDAFEQASIKWGTPAQN